MIEHLFSLVKVGGPEVPSRDDPKFVPGTTKQIRPVRRLNAVKRYPASLVTATLRIGFMVALAGLLILVLLPAAIAAQAAGLH